jgi:hypothetical protein
MLHCRPLTILGTTHAEMHQSGGDECLFACLLRVMAAKITASKETKAQARDRMRDKTDVPPAHSPMSQTPSEIALKVVEHSSNFAQVIAPTRPIQVHCGTPRPRYGSYGNSLLGVDSERLVAQSSPAMDGLRCLCGHLIFLPPVFIG